ncbi:putative EF-hand domain-containing protein [Helianthus annuus]|nr:putative EF-hand domain-containing protein [Helianthus annuus]KAJ0792274.1 putative EF-hand domain-containing protein [Helianthus annuus]
MVNTRACKVVSQQEIVFLYRRFCQLDRNAKGFISADEFLSRLLKMVDGLNFKDFVIFLSAFNPKASMPQKIERKCHTLF